MCFYERAIYKRAQPFFGSGPPQRPLTFYAIFAGDAEGVAILALFEPRAPHGVSL